jgi:hypothetical protein
LMLPFPIVLHDRFVGKVPIYLVAFLCMVVCVCFPRNGCKKERRQETITLDDKERFFLRHFLEGSVHGFWAAWTQWLHMVQSLQLKSELLLVFSKWKLLGNPTSKIKIFQNLSCFFFPNFQILENSHGFSLQTRPVVASPPGSGGGGPLAAAAAALVARGIAGAAFRPGESGMRIFSL